jgi:hypothetical protein
MTAHGQRWCYACGKAEDFDANWFEVWLDAEGRCVVTPVSTPADYHNEFRGDIFACGQLGALILVERYLHARTFDPTSAPEHTPEQFAYELNRIAEIN